MASGKFNSEHLRHEVEELRTTAQGLIRDAARPLDKSIELEENVSSHASESVVEK
jgi:hypothetical protein